MKPFEVEMQHDEDSLEALSHMQYDLFCTRNRIVRSLLSFGLVLLGVVNYASWWGILVIAYGCYLTTSTYASANHTARKLSKQLKDAGMSFPCSKYRFGKESMQVILMPEGDELEPLPYSAVLRLGEDARSFYLFRDPYGGYMIPKSQLSGREAEFRRFIEQKTGMTFHRKRAPINRLRDWIRRRENESYHL